MMTSPAADFFSSLAVYRQPRIIAMLFLGFASGLPLALTASTLFAWLSDAGVDKTTIGLFAAIATPYAFKFLWSPLMDAAPFPVLCKWLGRRRGWLAAMQIALVVALIAMAFADPALDAWWVALMALCVSTASASQDIVIDAYRVEMLPPEQQGAGAAMAVLGYRFGMIVSSAGALYLADYAGWTAAYLAMAALVPIGLLTVLAAGEPESRNQKPEIEKSDFRFQIFVAWIRRAVIEPFADFMGRSGWWAILLFILLYKFGDAFLGVMTNPFLLELGFTKTNIANIVKLYGLIATIAGSFAGGALVYRFGIVKMLFVCGFFHALTNLMFVVQARVGVDMEVLALGITLENFTGGMSTTAFVAYLSGLCNVQYTATQYALLSSLASAGRTWLSTPAGWVAEKLGWEMFFILAVLLAFPSLALLWWMERRKKENWG